MRCRVSADTPPVPGFKLLEQLAVGPTGTTYSAIEEATEREVALKVVRGPVDARRRARLLREATAAAAVSHLNVLRVINAGEHRDRAWVTFELVSGAPLADLLAARGRLGWREAARLGAQLARALAAVHAAGFVHRDVSPESVLRTEEGLVKLADLGLVRALAPGEDALGPRLTPDGEVVGSPGYMAPEAATSSGVGPAADLYSLGALLHHLVAGRPPFEGPDEQDVLRQHLHEAPPPLSTLVEGVPPALEGLVLRLLSKKPEARHASAEEVAEALDIIGATRADEAWPQRRWNRGALLGLGLLVAMSLAGHAVFKEAIFGPSIPRGAAASIGAPGATNAPVDVSVTTPETVFLQVAFSAPGRKDLVVLERPVGAGQSSHTVPLPGADGDYTLRVLLNGHVAAQQPLTVDRAAPGVSVAVVAVAADGTFCVRVTSDDPTAWFNASRGHEEGGRFWVPLQDDYRGADAQWREVDFTAHDPAGNTGRLTVRLARPPRLPPGMRETRWVPADGGRCLVQGYAWRLQGQAPELDMVYVPPTKPTEDDGFFVARHEVTVAQLALGFLPPRAAPKGRPDLPAQGLSRSEVDAWLVDSGLRLPRPDEWLRAATRPLVVTTYPWGEEPPDAQRCVWGALHPDRPSATLPVAAGRDAGASFFGCVDLLGNVSEWCTDWRARGGSVASRTLALDLLDERGAWTGLRPVLSEPDAAPPEDR